MKKARDIREQLVGLCERVEIELVSSSDIDDIRKAITAGFFFNCAKVRNASHGPTAAAAAALLLLLMVIWWSCVLPPHQLTKSQDYQTLKHAHTVYIHPSSVLAKDQRDGVLHSHLIYHELAFTSKEYMRDCTPIQVGRDGLLTSPATHGHTGLMSHGGAPVCRLVVCAAAMAAGGGAALLRRVFDRGPERQEEDAQGRGRRARHLRPRVSIRHIMMRTAAAAGYSSRTGEKGARERGFSRREGRQAAGVRR